MNFPPRITDASYWAERRISYYVRSSVSSDGRWLSCGGASRAILHPIRYPHNERAFEAYKAPASPSPQPLVHSPSSPRRSARGLGLASSARSRRSTEFERGPEGEAASDGRPHALELEGFLLRNGEVSMAIWHPFDPHMVLCSHFI